MILNSGVAGETGARAFSRCATLLEQYGEFSGLDQPPLWCGKANPVVTEVFPPIVTATAAGARRVKRSAKLIVT